MPSPTQVPTARPSATPAESGTGFTIEVVPVEEPPEVRAAIPGQQIPFLVAVGDPSSCCAFPARVSATAVGATIAAIDPVVLPVGTVGEVWVVPDASSVETTATVTISVARGTATMTATRTIPIRPMVDERAADAKVVFDRWASWLAKVHPELGITAATAWRPVFASTLLVVSHYLYFSDDWELGLSWHIMIPPSDWSRIYLRHRGTEIRPSIAFEISSLAGNVEPKAIEPPEAVTR